MKPYSTMTEAQLQEAVAGYLVTKYPNVLFHSDYGSGIKLTPGQAAVQKRQNGGRRAWPDLEIAQPKRWNRTCDLPFFIKDKYDEYGDYLYFGKKRMDSSYLGRPSISLVYQASGLYIELKKDGTRLKKRNGSWATEHIAEQAEVLDKLRRRGYCAEFAVGFDEAKRIIDEYLGG
ncbi:MAG: hypothetical protein NC548_27150 [Lachnospiraceae bacterium]|nr:hypothetical protein [Lachnospiraceae bacterium]